MGHYYTNDDNLVTDEKVIKVNVLNKVFNFITDNGVFSKEFLDYGTKLLLETIKVNDQINGGILDVGCGYGALGLVLASQTDKIVTMVDVNIRALKLCEKNAIKNNLENVSIYESNIYENVEGQFSTVVTNPPIRAGKEVVHTIILDAYEYLVDGGELFIVIKKQHGAKSALKVLRNKYQCVEVLKKDKGYYIIKCKK